MTKRDFSSIVLAVLTRAPEWVRVDLASKDAGTRQRAEETLAAIIAAAVHADEVNPNDCSQNLSSDD